MNLLFILLQASTFLSIGNPLKPPPPIEDGPTIHLSADQGKSWSDFTRGIEKGQTPNDIFELGNSLFLTTKPGQLYRMFLSDEDRCWERITEGLPENLWIKTLTRSGDNMVFGTFDEGIYLSSDGGSSWSRPVENIDSRILSLLYQGDELLAATDDGIYHSMDDGQSWELKEKIYGINDLVVHNGSLLLIGNSRIGTIENQRVNWSKSLTSTSIREVMPHQEYLYFRTADGEVYRTKDGLEWEASKEEFVRIPTGPLPEALFTGYKSELPQAQFAKNLLRATSFGWVSIKRLGC